MTTPLNQATQNTVSHTANYTPMNWMENSRLAMVQTAPETNCASLNNIKLTLQNNLQLTEDDIRIKKSIPTAIASIMRLVNLQTENLLNPLTQTLTELKAQLLQQKNEFIKSHLVIKKLKIEHQIATQNKINQALLDSLGKIQTTAEHANQDSSDLAKLYLSTMLIQHSLPREVKDSFTAITLQIKLLWLKQKIAEKLQTQPNTSLNQLLNDMLASGETSIAVINETNFLPARQAVRPSGIGYALMTNIPCPKISTAELFSIPSSAQKTKQVFEQLIDGQIKQPSSPITLVNQGEPIDTARHAEKEGPSQQVETITLSFTEESESLLQSPINKSVEVKAEPILPAPEPLISYDENDRVSVLVKTALNLIRLLIIKIEKTESEHAAKKMTKHLLEAQVSAIEHHDSTGNLFKEALVSFAFHFKKASSYSQFVEMRSLCSLLGQHFKVAWLSCEFLDARQENAFLAQPGATMQQGRSFDIAAGLGVGLEGAAAAVMPSIGVVKTRDVEIRANGDVVSGESTTKKIGIIGRVSGGVAAGLKGSAEVALTASAKTKKYQVNDKAAGISSGITVLPSINKSSYIPAKEFGYKKYIFNKFFSSAELLEYKRKAINAENTSHELNALLNTKLNKNYIINTPIHVYTFAKELISSKEKSLAIKGKASASLGFEAIASASPNFIGKLSFLDGSTSIAATMTKKQILEEKIISLEDAIASSELDPNELPAFILEVVKELIGDEEDQDRMKSTLLLMNEYLSKYMQLVGRYDYVKSEAKKLKLKLLTEQVEKEQLKALKNEIGVLKMEKYKIENFWKAKNRGQFFQIMAASLGYLKLKFEKLKLADLEQFYLETISILRHPTINIDTTKFTDLTSTFHSAESKDVTSDLTLQFLLGPIFADIRIKLTTINHPNPFRSGDFIKVELELNTTELGALLSNLSLTLQKISEYIHKSTGLVLDLLVDIKAGLIESKSITLIYSFYKVTDKDISTGKIVDFNYIKDYMRIMEGNKTSVKLKGGAVISPAFIAARGEAALRTQKSIMKKEVINLNSLRHLVMRHIGFVNATNYQQAWDDFCVANAHELKQALTDIANLRTNLFIEVAGWMGKLMSLAKDEKEKIELSELKESLNKTAEIFSKEPDNNNYYLAALEQFRRLLVKLAIHAINAESSGRITRQPVFKRQTSITF